MLLLFAILTAEESLIFFTADSKVLDPGGLLYEINVHLELIPESSPLPLLLVVSCYSWAI
ncbi:hypothetical protein ECANGB1_2668 [Enterospora canceri]|uniref:Uncharacterized protein n=1 Tax=Enterospora canceri TaxID=1081671 RepID=A0A1Y1S6C0_9MICR|nr:hypothetical protein ECANGB1_2668 [Enterospora canceri]